MTCEYCGLARPVPDADRRRQQMEKAERARRKAEEKVRSEGERRAQKEKEKREGRRRSAVSWVLTLPLKLLPLLVVGFVAYQLGLYHAFFGDPGRQHLDAEVERLKGEGYAGIGAVQQGRVLFGPTTLYLTLEQGKCYALALGAGRRITQVRLQARSREEHTAGRTNEMATTARLCPRAGGVRQARVTLTGAGRFSWALLHRDAPALKVKAAPQPRRRVRRRRPARLRRRSPATRRRPERTAPTGRSQQVAPPQEGDEPVEP